MTVRIGQLSDTHFLEPGHEPEGGFAYDTSAAFEAVAADISHFETTHELDSVVVTGDIADHGRKAQYRLALTAFEQLLAPVAVTPGNHDQASAFTVGMSATKVTTPRVVHRDDWCFAFVDSNAGIMVDDGTGHRIDPPSYGDRLHRNGLLGSAEATWLRQICATTAAPHVFVWVHHPPGGPDGIVRGNEEYDEEWRTLLASVPNVRGIGAGHTHMPGRYDFEGVPVFVCPSLKNNFDLEAETMLPPGWCSYRFQADGSIEFDTHLVDDDRWPRRALPRSVVALLKGEISFERFAEIVAARQART